MQIDFSLLPQPPPDPRLLPSLRPSLPPGSIMFIEFSEFTSNTHAVVQRALEFVGADPQKLRFKELPPGMQVGWGWLKGVVAEEGGGGGG